MVTITGTIEAPYVQAYMDVDPECKERLRTKEDCGTQGYFEKGYWDLGITLKSSNGATLTVKDRYPFKSSFVGDIACNNAMNSYLPAAQDLIRKVVTHPQFKDLAKP